MTTFALILIAIKNLRTQVPNYTIGISSVVLIVLALLLVVESIISIYKKETAHKSL